MTDPKVSQKKMVSAFDELVSFYVDRSPSSGDVPEYICDAIRVAIEERGRLREKIEEWQQCLRVRDIPRAACLTDIERRICDFKLDGEEEE